MESIIHQLKYGVGSPGETSNAILTSYLQAKAQSPLATTEELFTKVYLLRKFAEDLSVSYGIKDGNYALLSLKELLYLSDGCSALFTFILMCVDSKTFYDNVALDRGLFDIVTKIIFDNALEKVPSILIDNYESFNPWCAISYERIRDIAYGRKT